MNAPALVAIDSGISASLTVSSASAATYCLTETVSGETWSVTGPGPASTDFKSNATCS